MRLVSCNVKDLMALPERKHADLYSILTNFLNSNDICVRVEDYPHRSAASCAVAVRESIKRFYAGQIKVIQRKGNVYLVKTGAIK